MQRNKHAIYKTEQMEPLLNVSRPKLPEKGNLQSKRLKYVEGGLQNNDMLSIENVNHVILGGRWG